MSWHIYLFWGFSTTTKPGVPLIIIPNNEYGKYYPGAAARPEYGSVFRVSLPIIGLISSWSLDKYIYYIYMYLHAVSLNNFSWAPPNLGGTI